MYADCQSSETLSHVTFDSFLGQQIKILLRLFEAPGQEEFFRKVSMESRHPVSSFEFICRLDANEDNATSSDISDKFYSKQGNQTRSKVLITIMSTTKPQT